MKIKIKSFKVLKFFFFNNIVSLKYNYSSNYLIIHIYFFLVNLKAVGLFDCLQQIHLLLIYVLKFVFSS